MHLAWDIMVGVGTLLLLLSALVRDAWLSGATCRGVAGSSGSRPPRASSVDHAWRRAGWSRRSVANLDRVQPHEGQDVATGNTGVWITFLAVVAMYVASGSRPSPSCADESTLPGQRGSGTFPTDPGRPRRPEDLVHGTAAAVVLFFGVVAYALFGGADFGAGFWDLIAGGTNRGTRPRELIDHSIGPVWEANHVWLIFIFVVLWTCFPEAYESISLTLFVPLTVAAFGIVLRGSGFAFRKVVLRTSDGELRRVVRHLLGARAVLVGSVIGGVASGRVPAGGRAGDPWSSWVNPTSILGGVVRRRGGRVPGLRVSGLGCQTHR